MAKTKKKLKAKPKPKAKTKTKVKSKTLPKKKVQAKAKKPMAKISLKSLAEIGLSPLADRLIVKIDSAEKRTAGGLYIPDTAQVSGNYRGQVLAVGRGNTNKKGHLRPMDVKTGDQILFSEYAGSKMTIDGLEVLILRETDVLGVVEK